MYIAKITYFSTILSLLSVFSHAKLKETIERNQFTVGKWMNNLSGWSTSYKYHNLYSAKIITSLLILTGSFLTLFLPLFTKVQSTPLSLPSPPSLKKLLLALYGRES
jgi:hypothetical protein